MFRLVIHSVDANNGWISSNSLVDATYNDLGGNIAENNGKCNGIFVERQNGKCIKLNYDLPSLPAPTQPAIPTNAPRGGLGYFNYDKEDDEYGPNGWGDVKYSTDFIRYKELQGTLRRSLINKCNWKNVKQSPIDLCESYINNDCKEHHQTRTHVSANNSVNILYQVYLTIFSVQLRVVISSLEHHKLRPKFFQGKLISFICPL